MELRTEVRKSERGAAAEAVRRVPELHRLRRSSADWVEPHRRHAPAVSAVLRIRAGYGDHICRDLMLSSHFRETTFETPVDRARVNQNATFCERCVESNLSGRLVLIIAFLLPKVHAFRSCNEEILSPGQHPM